jgi:hypothetical protein
MNDNGVRAFPPLAGIETLFIAVDNDEPDPDSGKRPGQDAARACSARWTAAGREVWRLTPRAAGKDLNDVVGRPAP